MHLNREEWLVLEFLAAASGFTTTFEIAQGTGLHQRMVREYMRNVRIRLEKEGFELLSVRSKGYQIRPVYPNTLADLQELIREHRERQEITQSERMSQLLERLAGRMEYLKLDDMAETMCISRSTINQDFALVKKELKRYGLRVESRPGYGVRVEGDEIRLRQLLCDRLFDRNKGSLDWFRVFFDNTQPDSPEYRIRQILRRKNFVFSDIALLDLLLYLSVSLFRAACGRRLEREVNSVVPVSEDAMEAATDIADLVREELHLELNFPEIQRLAMEILSKSTCLLSRPSAFAYKEALLDEIERQLYEKLRRDYSASPVFRQELSQLLESILYHLAYGTKRRNSLFGTDSWNRSEAAATECLCQVIESFAGAKLGQGDRQRLNYLLHVQDIHQTHKKSAVLVVGTIDPSNVQVLEYFLPRKHSYYVSQVRVVSLNTLTPNLLHWADAILNTVPVWIETDKPVLKISPLLTQVDHQKIRVFLKKISIRENLQHFFCDSRLFEGNRLQDKADLKALAQLLEPVREGSAGQFRKALQQGLEETFFSYHNGFAVAALPEATLSVDTILPVWLPQQEDFQLLFFVNHRNDDRALFETISEVLAGITAGEASAVLKKPAFLPLLDFLREKAREYPG